MQTAGGKFAPAAFDADDDEGEEEEEEDDEEADELARQPASSRFAPPSF